MEFPIKEIRVLQDGDLSFLLLLLIEVHAFFIASLFDSADTCCAMAIRESTLLLRMFGWFVMNPNDNEHDVFSIVDATNNAIALEKNLSIELT